MEVRLQDTCSDDQLHRLSYLRPRRASARKRGDVAMAPTVVLVLPLASAGGRRELSICRCGVPVDKTALSLVQIDMF